MKPVIVCVDDEKLILDSLKTQLQHRFISDYDLEIAESGEEALELLQELLEDQIEIPLVISDQIMPGMKGDELLVEINKISPKTNKILLTGQASAEAVGNALNNAKLYRYISKPWEETDLVLTVKEAIKSYYKDKTIVEKNEALEESIKALERANGQLEDYNVRLESLVKERTEQVIAQKEEIEKKSNSMLASINYAYRIQNAMLPNKKKLLKKFPNAFIYFEPKNIVSGDFYWFSEMNDLFIVAAIDCTGHGVPGAILSMIGMRELNNIIFEYRIVKPHLILKFLHEGVRSMLQQEEGSNRDGMDASICAIDKPNNKVYFSGAKNSLVYVNLKENGEKVINQIKGDPKSIGGFQKEKLREFTLHEFDLKYPSNLYLFSDGIQDQFGGTETKKFGKNNLINLLTQISHQPPDNQYKILDKTFKDWKGSNKQIDDIMLLGLLC